MYKNCHCGDCPDCHYCDYSHDCPCCDDCQYCDDCPDYGCGCGDCPRWTMPRTAEDRRDLPMVVRLRTDEKSGVAFAAQVDKVESLSAVELEEDEIALALEPARAAAERPYQLGERIYQVRSLTPDRLPDVRTETVEKIVYKEKIVEVEKVVEIDNTDEVQKMQLSALIQLRDRLNKMIAMQRFPRGVYQTADPMCIAKLSADFKAAMS